MSAAFIRRLSLTNFRSYHAAQVALASAGPVVLTGANGAGKTNLIEAISLLAPGRGLRRAGMEELAFAEGDGAWAVSAEIEGMLGLATLGTGIDPPAGEDSSPSRKCRIDRESVVLGGGLRRSLTRGVAHPGDGPAVQRPGLRAAPFPRPPGARRRCAAFQPRRRARALLALAQPAPGRPAQRSALARRGRARNRRSRGGGRRRARGNGESTRRRAHRRARHRAGISRAPRSRSTAGWRSCCPITARPKSRTAIAPC